MLQESVHDLPASTADEKCAQHSSPHSYNYTGNESQYLCSLHLLCTPYSLKSSVRALLAQAPRWSTVSGENLLASLPAGQTDALIVG